MNILIVDADVLSLSLCMKFIAWGHSIKLYMAPVKGKEVSVGDGIVSKVRDWRPHVKWADLVITTLNETYTTELALYRKKGIPIIGGNLEAQRWELDRGYGMGVLRRAGVKTLPEETFNNYDQAIAYVKKAKRRLVSKPNGVCDDKSLSYVGKSVGDMVYMLEQWKKKGKPKNEFVLQDFEPGIEFSVGGWFGKGGFCQQWCENFEHKTLMNDDVGPNTGEMGTVLRYTTESKLADEMLRPVEGMLHGIDYVGYIDMNCIVNDKGQACPLEWTPRFGWPLLQIQLALHKGDPAEFLLDLFEGFDTLKVTGEVAVGVVRATKGLLCNKMTDEEYCGFPIYGVEEKDVIKDVCLSTAKRGKAPDMETGEMKEMYVTAGAYVATVVGTGKTVKEASSKAYKINDKIKIPGSPIYRTDIGCRLEKQLPELQEHGYAEGLEYGG